MLGKKEIGWLKKIYTEKDNWRSVVKGFIYDQRVYSTQSIGWDGWMYVYRL